MSEEKKCQEQAGTLATIPTTDKPTIWNNAELMQLASRQANMLAGSGLVPEGYQKSPANCLIAIDFANRMNIPPLMVMQNLYVVKGKPSWSGAFCAAPSFSVDLKLLFGEKTNGNYATYRPPRNQRHE
jgi:hypothetical protein